MSPVLRGETALLPSSALFAVRERLPREWGHETVTTPAGPVLVIRAPAEEPDLLRDVEGAADALPRLELSGYRGCILLGDRAQLGVSVEMLASLLRTRAHAEDTWVAQHRIRLGAWEPIIARLPSDPHRRLRAVIRVDATRVSELRESDFDRLAALIPTIRQASPGQTRPHWVHLVAHEDDVRLDGARFFQELEQRAARLLARADKRAQEERERRHEIARANLDRVLHRPQPPTTRERHAVPERTPRPVEARRPATPRVLPPAPTERPRTPFPPPRSVPPTARTVPPPPSPAPRERPAAPPAPDPRTRGITHLKRAFSAAGYEIRQDLSIQDVPIAIAAARPEGYPRRVVVSFWDRLEADDARRLLTIGRGVGAELVLAVAARTGDGVDRVTLATNLKVITPDAVEGLRLD